MIELKDISFSYGENLILSNFNLTVENGKAVCITGASGCGKTTVSRIILGLIKNYKGALKTESNISAVFQEDRFVDSKSLLSNLKFILSKQQFEYALYLIEKFGLKESAQKPFKKLSGGMKRRAAIIRAIAYGGDALVLDEAFNGIDYDNKVKIAQVIKTDFLSKNKPVLIISHSLEDAKLLNAEIIKI